MLYVECKPDQVLAQKLTGLPQREIGHALKGRPEVLRFIAEKSNSIAMVDEDPGSRPPAIFGRMLRNENETSRGLVVYYDRGRNNRVVVICPKLEDWVLRAAQDVRIRVNAPPYSLPGTSKSLHKIINNRLDQFETLVDALLAAHSPRILKLQELLTQ